jgi:hypothetical protein
VKNFLNFLGVTEGGRCSFRPLIAALGGDKFRSSLDTGAGGESGKLASSASSEVDMMMANGASAKSSSHVDVGLLVELTLDFWMELSS